MELDFTDTPLDTRSIKPHEIEEVFEDPFSIRLLPTTNVLMAKPGFT